MDPTHKISIEAIENLTIYIYENERGERLTTIMNASNFKFPFELSKCKKYTTSFKAMFGKIVKGKHES